MREAQCKTRTCTRPIAYSLRSGGPLASVTVGAMVPKTILVATSCGKTGLMLPNVMYPVAYSGRARIFGEINSEPTVNAKGLMGRKTACRLACLVLL